MLHKTLLSLTFAALATPAVACGYDFFRIQDLDFLDDSHGFRITNAGLQESVDGGRKWKDLRVDGVPKDRAFNTRPYTELDIAEGTLFLLSPANHKGHAKLHISDDLGHDWRQVDLAEGMHPLHIDFVSAAHGFVQLADNRLLVTNDGAETWMEVAQAPKNMQVHQLRMMDSQKGFALALLPRDGKYINLLLTTRNGGHDWAVHEMGSTELGHVQLVGMAHDAALLQTGNRVVMAGLEGSEPQEIFVAADGKTIGEVIFKDALTGVVSQYDNATGESQVLLTHDGGQTFSVVPDFIMEYDFAWTFSPGNLKVVSMQDFFLEVPTMK